MDYGEDAPLGTTLQGVKEHKYAHVLSEVGDVDLSALVNFKALSRAVYYTNSHESIKTFTKGMQRYR